MKGNKIQSLKNIKVNFNGFKKLLCSFNENMATGPEEIPGELLKLVAEELTPFYTRLFQASLDQVNYLRTGKQQYCVTFLKKGNKTKSGN